MREYTKLKKWVEPVFSIGHIGPGMLNQFILLWTMKYYKDTGLLTGVMIGWALLSGKMMDAVAEPFIANWSDNLRSKKYGRRIPFIMFGAIPLVISFVMLWNIPFFNNTAATFTWFFIWVNIFYFSYNAVVNPYFALLPELFENEGDRARVQGYVALFGILGMGIAMGGSGVLIQNLGYPVTAIILAVFCAVVLFAPFFTVKVNKDFVFNENIPRENTIKNLLAAVSSKLFIKYIFGFGLFYFGFNMVQGGLAFIGGTLLGLQEGATSIMMISSVVVALLFIPVYQRIIKKRGSFFALKVAILSYAVVAVCLPLVTRLPFAPMVNGLVLMAFMGFPYSGLMVIPNVLLSRIIDEDTKKTGHAREGMFFGAQGLITNSVIALAALTNGYLFDFLGSTAEKPWGVIVLGPFAAVMAMIGFFALRKEK